MIIIHPIKIAKIQQKRYQYPNSIKWVSLMKINFDSINVINTLKNDEVLMYQEGIDEVVLTPVKKSDISWGHKIQAFFGLGPYNLRCITYLVTDILQKLPTELPQESIATLNARITRYNNYGLRRLFSCLQIGQIELPKTSAPKTQEVAPKPLPVPAEQPVHTLDHLAIKADSDHLALHTLVLHAWANLHRTPDTFASDLPRYKELVDACLRLDDKDLIEKFLLAENANKNSVVAASCLLNGQRWAIDKILQVVDDELLLRVTKATLHVGNEEHSIVDYLLAEDDEACQTLRRRIQQSQLLQDNIQHESLNLL